MTDLVSLVRFAMHQENELVPFPERVAANFKAWLGQQEAAGRSFTPEQRKWLEMIRDHIAANLGIDVDDFEYAPFAQEGGIGKVHQLFGAELPKVLDELNKDDRYIQPVEIHLIDELQHTEYTIHQWAYPMD
jgi:type I restriction enzyme R subunit